MSPRWFPLSRRALPAVLLIAGFTIATPVQALNILLCNDDGLTAANIRALKQTLVRAGHSVIVTAPLDNQSGFGGYVPFLRPIPSVVGTERGARALGLAAGAAGVGTDPSDPDVFYVNSTPVTACLYGIDVQARRKWQAAPDLVISGPNEGNNTGAVNPSSGTFNNLVYAINRNLPALAVSDALTTQVTWSTTLAATARPFEVAAIVSRLVDALVTNRSRAGGQLMPTGVGLNVNVPEFAAGAGAALPMRFTRIGKSTGFVPVFVERLSDSPLAVASGVNLPLPGISVAAARSTLPNGVIVPADTAASSEANVIAARTAVTISPVEGVPEARRVFEDALRIKLNGIAP
jgi:5'-nucleotidase